MPLSFQTCKYVRVFFRSFVYQRKCEARISFPEQCFDKITWLVQLSRWIIRVLEGKSVQLASH